MPNQKIDIEILKRHMPWVAKIFDQIAETKASEAEYRIKYKGQPHG